MYGEGVTAFCVRYDFLIASNVVKTISSVHMCVGPASFIVNSTNYVCSGIVVALAEPAILVLQTGTVHGMFLQCLHRAI